MARDKLSGTIFHAGEGWTHSQLCTRAVFNRESRSVISIEAIEAGVDMRDNITFCASPLHRILVRVWCALIRFEFLVQSRY